ncbi:MAG TPA: polysaccharide deacetylase family protein, partial [Acidobacteriota bacterium]|nr:polysaccharide deacetylase family protein [Acidobacteriota bacterium]
MKFKLILLVCFSIVFLLPAKAANPHKPVEKRQRLVAVTFDDLPSPEKLDVQSLETLTRNLLKTFTQYKIPVVGFVNEGKLEVENEKAARTRV